ncbi:MAG: leucine-rich repeat domain-containing protein, partial [Treponema sp.]|nr:leucine-rich repeat domain-containing protein [Treponema sp.]
GCSSLKAITLPKGLISIGELAFVICWNLKTVTLPASLIAIGGGAFAGCPSLESITVPALEPPVLDGELVSVDIPTIYVPAAALAAYKNAPGWKDYADRIRAIGD